MKILMLNYEFPPMGGGAGRATLHIASELTRLGHEVDILTSRLHGEKVCERLQGFTVYRVFSFRKSIHDCGFCGALSFVLFAVPRFLTLTQKKYDIIHCFFSLPTGLLMLLPGRSRGCPSVVSLRGSDVPHYDPFNRPLELAHGILKPVSRKIWREADRVVALSHSLRRMAHLTNPRQRIDIVPNGIDATLFRPLGGKRPRGSSPLKLVSVARLIERKGIQHVLAAMATLWKNGITLSIAGTGNYENELKALCRQLGLEHAVRFHGYCSREYLVTLYNEADVFILPSMRESFGMVFLEAMACGLPIIGGRTGGVPTIVADDNGILVPPGDVDAIRKAIMKMDSDPEARRAMAASNRRKVTDHYDWQCVAGAYLKIYQDIRHERRMIDNETLPGGSCHERRIQR